jgi:glutamine synthetase
MPKPLFGENGSGMHTHQSLFRGGANAFYDADDKYFLSPVGKAFIAGQLRHAREICSIFAQWVNSYKRLVPGYEAPVYVAWSRRNRSALVRVPLYHPGKEQATRMELRCPDPACNPYLTFAALLHAGLEGIEKGYELPEPMEKNLYHLSPDDRKRLGIEQLPRRWVRRSSSPRSQSSSSARSASTCSIASSRSSARSGRTTGCRSRPGSSTATCPFSERATRRSAGPRAAM